MAGWEEPKFLLALKVREEGKKPRNDGALCIWEQSKKHVLLWILQKLHCKITNLYCMEPINLGWFVTVAMENEKSIITHFVSVLFQFGWFLAGLTWIAMYMRQVVWAWFQNSNWIHDSSTYFHPRTQRLPRACFSQNRSLAHKEPSPTTLTHLSPLLCHVCQPHNVQNKPW